MITSFHIFQRILESVNQMQIIQLPEFQLKLLPQQFPELLPYNIYDLEGNLLGDISLVVRKDCFQVHKVELKTPGQGIGFRLYVQLIQFLNLPLESGPIRSEDANDLWSKLVRTNHATYFPERNYYRSI